MKFRPDIQILRGVAVLIVLLFHFQIDGFENGFLGVDIFFVLSGYLMAQLYDKGSAKDFYVRRLKRLLPAYIVTIALTTFVVALVAVPSDANQSFDRLSYHLLGLGNIAFWFENSYFYSGSFRPLLNLWSLGVELQYYLLVPFLLPILRNRKILLYAVIAASMVSAFLLTTVSPKTSFFMMPFRIWEFLIGASVAWSFASSGATKARGLLTSFALMACVFAVLTLSVKEAAHSVLFGHPGLAALLISLATAAVLTRPLHAHFSENNLIGKTLVRLGDYSYSIYLVHFPVIVLMNYQAFGGTTLGADSFGKLALIVGATAVLAFLMYHIVESTRTRKNFSKHFILLAAMSLALISSSGFVNNSRYTPEQQAIFHAWVDRDVYRCGKVFRVLNPGETVCPIGEGGRPEKVLLIGNSHADSIKTSFAESMTDKGVTPHFYVFNDPLMRDSYNAKSIASDIERLGISHVALHFSPGFYGIERLVNQMSQLMSVLKSKDIPVYLISPVPTYGYHVPSALYEQTTGARNSLDAMKVEKHLQMKKPFFDFAKAQANEYSLLFSPHEYLCPDRNDCLKAIEGKPLYFDDAHLTLTGADVLRPMFDLIAGNVIGRD